jgi:predicted phosphate transport protein (TIGR00153 family)
MRFRLVPTDDRFFGLFLDGVRNVETSAVALEDMVGDLTSRKIKRDAIHELERVGDRITRDTLSRLSQSFVTPFDREDIHAICEGIDDVLDEIYHVADLLFLLEIDQAIPEMIELCEILRKAAGSTVALFERFESMKGLDGLLEEIDRLESEGDGVYRRALARLFREGDPMAVLSWKDIIGTVETAVDRLEDVGNLVESVVVKHA